MYVKEEVDSSSLWDSLWARKRDVLKLLFLSLTILAAISTHSVVSTYLTRWIDDADWTPRIEAIVRVAYPVTVVLVLWLLKALSTPASQ